jgi:DNA-binding CsgD family transcriptional regulator
MSDGNSIHVNALPKSQIKDVPNVELKPKEVRIMYLLSQGLTYQEMAQEVGISVDGIRFYIKRIYKKLDVNNARKALDVYFN